MPVRIPSPRGLSLEGPAAPTRDAATVALLRDGGSDGSGSHGSGSDASGSDASGSVGSGSGTDVDEVTGDGVAVYLMRRAASMAFAASMYVFPGGSVDARDADLPDAAWAGPSVAEWAQRLGADDARARLLVCAAVRETFEECGVLLAGPDASSVVADLSGQEWETERLALLDRSISLTDLLTRRGLVLRTDLLRAWAHWITPEAEPKRFDTRFFVAALPSGQIPRDPGQESDHARWATPAQVQQGLAAGEMRMLPPTIAVCSSLAEHPDVASVLASTAEIAPVMPKMTQIDGEWFIYLPGEPGYDEISAREVGPGDSP